MGAFAGLGVALGEAGGVGIPVGVELFGQLDAGGVRA